MKNRKYFGLLVLLALAPFASLRAQIIPAVFDKVQSSLTTYNQMLLDSDGQLRLLGVTGTNTDYLRLSPKGTMVHTHPIPGFNAMNVVGAKDGAMLIVGGKADGSAKARFIKIAKDDKTEIDYQYTANGYFDKVMALRNGGYILGGFEYPKGGGKNAIVVVLSAAGKPLFSTIEGLTDETCAGFAESNEGLISVAFSTTTMDARVAQYTIVGKNVFTTTLTTPFNIQAVKLTKGGELVLAGSNAKGEARVAKLRAEGDVVFDKTFGQSGASFTHLEISSDDEILLGGSLGNDKGTLTQLRNDGTTRFSLYLTGPVTSMAFSPRNDVFVASYSESLRTGSFVKASSIGRSLTDLPAAAKYDHMVINPSGEAVCVSTSAGRVTTFKEDGGVSFDSPIDKSMDPGFLVSAIGDNGDITFAGKGGRIAKRGHGLMIGSIAVQEPLNGFSLANVIVTLTGFQRRDGIPAAVTVPYKVVEGKAKAGEDFIVSSGVLSFIPADDGSGNYLITKTIEIPIKADNQLEGNEEFYVRLEQPENSYLIQTEASVTIVDQPVNIRFIFSDAGREPSTPITYTIGLFKSDGTKVTNQSGSSIIVRGIFGLGTADASDYNTDVKPYFVIEQGSSTATCQVGVKSDDKYEIPETVILQLNQVEAMSDVTVTLEGGLVSCTGYIYDQPAYMMLSSLGDKGKNSSTVQGFFRAALVRVSDDKPLINCTGSNVHISTDIDASSTAVKGEDFVLVNESELNIPGDCQKNIANINGVVLGNAARVGNASVVLRLTGVTAPEGAGALSIHPQKGTASFNILDSKK